MQPALLIRLSLSRLYLFFALSMTVITYSAAVIRTRQEFIRRANLNALYIAHKHSRNVAAVTFPCVSR